MKFQVAPGLPGYGTQGADGSDGFLGMSMYFSEFNGETEKISISGKLTDNKLLSKTSPNHIPGYPTRVYQDGDMFIDLNGKAYVIDFTLINNFKPTDSRLNTSTIFTEGPDTVHSPVYTRYSNSYTSDKFLVDTVYANNAPNNYAQAPGSGSADGLYGIGAIDFGRVSYVDNSTNGYQPFEIYTATNDVGQPEQAIALVKEYDKNVWHFGNWNELGGNIRDVSLYLDFKNIFIPEDINVIGDLTATNFFGGHLLKFAAGATNYITAEQQLIINTPDNPSGSTQNIKLEIGDAQSTTIGGYGGYISNQSGSGGDSTTSNGGWGGHYDLQTGLGGDHTGSVSGRDGGAGGRIRLIAGNGGDTNADTGGDGGYFDLDSGSGGDGSIGGDGGRFNIDLGDGGDGTVGSGNIGGDGGYFKLAAGAGGDASTAGNGGSIEILAGNGGTDIGSIISGKGDGGNILIKGGYGDKPSGHVTIQAGGLGDVSINAGATGTINIGDSNEIYYNRSSSVHFTNVPLSAYTTGDARLHIDSAGQLQHDTPSSDIRLKNITGYIEKASDKLSTLSTIFFKWNDLCINEAMPGNKDAKDNINLGLIAQEVEKVFPEVVGEFKGEDGEMYKTVEYDRFVPILVSSINEQTNEINDLKAIVEKQQDQINQLLKKL